MVPAMWAYNGFNDLGDLGEEITSPEGIFLARLFWVAVGRTLYLMANVVYFHVLPFTASPVDARRIGRGATYRGSAWSRGADRCDGHLRARSAACRHSYRRANPVCDGARWSFLSFAERVHPKFRTPSGSLLFLGGSGAALALTGTYEELYSLFVFAVWIFSALNAIALLRLRMKQPNLNRPYHAFGYPVTTIIFLVAAVALTVNLWLVRPVRSTLGLLVIAAGIPLFYRWRKIASASSN